MRIRKKNSQKNFQAKEEEEKISALFDRAEQGDTESMMRLLIKSGRGYEMKEEDLSEILRNRQEGT
jgi:hypothetical protein